MRATLFNKSLPNSCGYQEEEFITQAYLYLLPEWSDQWLLDFVVSENNLSYIPLIARSPATFSFASYSTRDFPVQLSVSLVVSVKNTKKYQISAKALHHKSCSHKQHGMTVIFTCYGNIVLFTLTTLSASAKGINTWDLDLHNYFHGFDCLNVTLICLRTYAKNLTSFPCRSLAVSRYNLQ